ncbi:hypothetical protein [Sanguibacter sp. 25GB23B1]|uniref:hypothetical protein n=1 Tax=unclassified Sanguibacter TaxID=2645534 RepID=UPI0032AEA3C6
MITTSIGHPEDGDPVSALLAARRRRHDTAAREEVAVLRARTHGLAWSDIASLLGEKRRTIRSRYGGSRLSR